MTYLVKGVQGNLAIWLDCNKIPFMGAGPEQGGSIVVACLLDPAQSRRCQDEACVLLRRDESGVDFISCCGVEIDAQRLDNALRTRVFVGIRTPVDWSLVPSYDPENPLIFSRRMVVRSLFHLIPPKCPLEFNKLW